jgi:hypothetical protein
MHAGWDLALGLSALASCVHVRRAWGRRGRAFRRRLRPVDVPAPNPGGGPMEIARESGSGSYRRPDDRKELPCAP